MLNLLMSQGGGWQERRSPEARGLTEAWPGRNEESRMALW